MSDRIHDGNNKPTGTLKKKRRRKPKKGQRLSILKRFNSSFSFGPFFGRSLLTITIILLIASSSYFAYLLFLNKQPRHGELFVSVVNGRLGIQTEKKFIPLDSDVSILRGELGNPESEVPNDHGGTLNYFSLGFQCNYNKNGKVDLYSLYMHPTSFSQYKLPFSPSNAKVCRNGDQIDLTTTRHVSVKRLKALYKQDGKHEVENVYTMVDTRAKLAKFESDTYTFSFGKDSIDFQYKCGALDNICIR